MQVFDKTLKGIRGVRLDNRKVLCLPGRRTEHFSVIFAQVNLYKFYKKSTFRSVPL